MAEIWEDILTLITVPTIRGHASIQNLLDTHLAASGLSVFHLLEDAMQGPTVIKPILDLVFIRFCFGFEMRHGKGTALLVPTPSGTWKPWSLLTRPNSLKAHLEKVSIYPRCSAYMTTCGLVHVSHWENRWRCEIDFDDSDPTVLIIGAGE